MIEHVEESIEYSEQQYNDAPYEIELKNIEFQIGEVKYGEELNGDPITGMGFEGTTQVDGQPVFTFMPAAAITTIMCAEFMRGLAQDLGFFGTYSDEPYGVSLTKEQVASQASEFAEQLTDELQLCYVVPTGGQKTRRYVS